MTAKSPPPCTGAGDTQTNKYCLPYSLKVAEERRFLSILSNQVRVFSTFQDIWKKRRPESLVQSTAVWLPDFFMPQCTHQGSDCLNALIQSPSAAQPGQLQPPSLKESLHHLIPLKSPQHILSQERIREQGSASRAWE